MRKHVKSILTIMSLVIMLSLQSFTNPLITVNKQNNSINKYTVVKARYIGRFVIDCTTEDDAQCDIPEQK